MYIYRHRIHPTSRGVATVLGPLNGLSVCAEDGLEGRQTLKAPHAFALHVTKTFFRLSCFLHYLKKENSENLPSTDQSACFF